MRLRALARFLVLLTLLNSGCHKSAPNTDSTGTAKWTLMFYSDADNDLEETAMNDLRQLLKLGESPQVRMVMLCDRSELDSSDDGYSNERIFNQESWDQALLLTIGKEELETVEDWGEVNMADPATLSRFVRTVQQKYPAERYALIIGDHGTGWEGACSDDSSEDEDDQLTIAEISTALADLPRLEVLGFDACLMATVEAAVALAPQARYMIASEELEPVLGWDYATIASILKERPDMDGEAFCRVILTSYQRSFQRDSNAEVRTEGDSITLSVLDLDKIAEVRDRLAAVSELIVAKLQSEGRAYWLVLATARTESEEYGADEGEEGSKAFDLLTLAQKIVENSPDPETRMAARNLARAVEQCVVGQVRGSARPGANGMSIYFPNHAELLSDYADLPTWQNGVGWPQALQAFLREAKQKPATLISGLEVSDEVALPHQPVTVEVDVVNSQEIAQLYFVLATREAGTLTLLGRRQIDLSARPQELWNGYWLSGPEGEIFPLQTEAGSRVPALLGGEEITLHMTQGEFVMATRQGSGGVRQIYLKTGETLYFLYPTVDDVGRQDTTTLEAIGLEIESRDRLDLSLVEVDPGEYEIGFLAVDHSGHWDLQVRPVNFGL